eukprot:m51a1_g1766 hypothetical protein (747) ;mRNA; r:306595-309031
MKRHALLLCLATALAARAQVPAAIQTLRIREQLIEGLPGRVFVGNSLFGASTITLFSPFAVSLLSDRRGEPVAAATLFPGAPRSGGKVCLLALDPSAFSTGEADFGLVSNCARWMTGNATGTHCVLHGALAGNASSFPGCASFEANAFAEGALQRAGLLAIDLALMAEGAASDTVARKVGAVRAFLKAGGSLIANANGYVWNYDMQGSTTNDPATLLLAEAGLAMPYEAADTPDNMAFVVPMSQFVPERSNIYAAFNALEQSRPNDDSTDTLNWLADHLTTLSDSFESGLLDKQLWDLPYEANDAIPPACDRFLETQPTMSDPVNVTERQRRACMRLAEILPINSGVVGFSYESSVFPGDVVVKRPATRVLNLTTTPEPRRIYTDMWVVGGSVLTIEVPQHVLSAYATVQIGMHQSLLAEGDQGRAVELPWYRWPVITTYATLRNATTTLEVRFGGVLSLELWTSGHAKEVAVTVTGHFVQAATFLSGSSPANFANAVRTTTASFATLSSQNVTLYVPSIAAKKVQDAAQVLSYWETAAQCFIRTRNMPAKFLTVHRPHLVADVQPPLAQRWDNFVAFAPSESPNVLMTRPAWNHWEVFSGIGRLNQEDMWTFAGTEGVTNRVFALICERELTGNNSWVDMEALRAAGAAYKLAPNFEQWKRNSDVALQMYVEIGQRFGWDVFPRVFNAYDHIAFAARPKSDSDKMDEWFVRVSQAAGRNLGSFFDSWAFPVSAAARNRVSELPPL